MMQQRPAVCFSLCMCVSLVLFPLQHEQHKTAAVRQKNTDNSTEPRAPPAADYNLIGALAVSSDVLFVRPTRVRKCYDTKACRMQQNCPATNLLR